MQRKYICSSRKLNLFFFFLQIEAIYYFKSVVVCRFETSPVCLCFAAWHYETPQRVQFVEKLSDVVIGQLPNFWKLWISYVNGSLFSEVNTYGLYI